MAALHTMRIARYTWIVFLLCSTPVFSQVAVRAFQFRPAAELGMVFDRKISFELQYLDDFDDGKRERLSISYTPLQPRLDSFPVYSTVDGYGLVVSEGYMVYHTYNLLLIEASRDHVIYERYDIYLYGGYGLAFGGADQKYDLVNGNRSESFEGGKLLAGINLRLGAEYMMSEYFGIFLDFKMSGYYMDEDGLLRHNELGLGLHVLFE